MKSVSQKNGPIRVLVVEDNPLDARLVFEYLEEASAGKFQLTHVGRLSEALKTLRTEKPDAILLDLTLPDASGTEGYTRIAQVAPGVPIIVLTGVEDASIEKQLLALGARDYMRKSRFEGRHLATVLANWVSLARGASR